MQVLIRIFIGTPFFEGVPFLQRKFHIVGANSVRPHFIMNVNCIIVGAVLVATSVTSRL